MSVFSGGGARGMEGCFSLLLSCNLFDASRECVGVKEKRHVFSRRYGCWQNEGALVVRCCLTCCCLDFSAACVLYFSLVR